MSLIGSVYCPYFCNGLIAYYVCYHTAQLIASWVIFYADKRDGVFVPFSGPPADFCEWALLLPLGLCDSEPFC